MTVVPNAPLARLHGVRKHRGRTLALDGLDLGLHAGQVLAMLGPNGAGKSTAVGVLLGLLAPDAGTAELFGLPPLTLAARRQAGVMLQTAGIPETLQVRELLALTRSYYPDPLPMDQCLALAGLQDLANRRYAALSGGQQRRVQFAMAVCGRPRLLFLDEPTTGLDIEARQALWQAIRQRVAQGCGVLLTTHYLEEAEALADQVLVLDRGRALVRGSVAEVRARVSQRRIGCQTRLPAAVVAAWPGVQEARVDEAGRLQVVATQAEAVVRRLLAEDPALVELEVRRAGLADAFLALTAQPAVVDGADVQHGEAA